MATFSPTNDTRIFYAAEHTGTGSSQNIGHPFGVAPVSVLVVPTDGGTVTEGAHDGTNIKVTCTNGKYKVLGFFVLP